jgi:Flp pilus assembly protein CpaB
VGSKRTLLSVAAVVLAMIAGLATYSYLHGVQNRAYRNATLVNVYRISASISKGTPGSALVSGKLVQIGQMPQQFLPSDAVTDLASIQHEVAAANLAPGQILESDLFVAPVSTTSSGSSTAQAIPKGDVAITVSVDAVHDVAGMVQPGDKVDIFIQDSTGAERFLYQNVDVMAVGTSVAPSGVATAQATSPTTAPHAAGSGLITFAVPPDAAARIVLAANGGATGSLYLALVPPGNTPSAQAPIAKSNLIPASLTPG